MAQSNRSFDAVVRSFVEEQGGHIILVSLDYGFASLLRGMFKTLGLGRIHFFRIEEADRYVETIKKILERSRSHQVLLFLEAKIQGKSLFEELRMAKQAFGDQCKIICLSPEVSTQMTAFAMESGADNVIVKPISMNSLLQKIASTVQPNNLRNLVSKCEDLIDSGDFEEASRLVENIFAQKKNSSVGFMLLGDIALKEKRYKDAEKHYLEASKQAELFLNPLKRLVRLYQEMGNIEDRLASLQRLDNLSPMNYERKIEIGKIYIAKEEPDKAQDFFDQAISTVKNHMSDMVSSVHMEIGKTYEQVDPETGYDHMNQALEIKKASMSRDDVWMYNEMGRNLRGRGLWQDAIENYEKARKIAPEDPQVLYNMGMAYAQGKRFKEAAKCMDKAIWGNDDMLSSNAAACYNIGMVFRHAKEDEKAIKYLKRCLKQDPSHRQAGEALKQIQGGVG